MYYWELTHEDKTKKRLIGFLNKLADQMWNVGDEYGICEVRSIIDVLKKVPSENFKE